MDFGDFLVLMRIETQGVDELAAMAEPDEAPPGAAGAGAADELCH